MCGITGVIYSNSDADMPDFKELTLSLLHRGSDGSGFFSYQGVYLGHTRLAIIDLDNGSQPMESSDGRYIIIFNGEIYNFKNLAKDLASKGYRFKTSSDTEVLLFSFQHWGKQMLDKIDGMFAFVIYDKVEKKLFCSRDRFGKKPFIYYHKDDLFIFSSELKTILNCKSIDKNVCHQSLGLYLKLGYVPAPYTIIKNCLKLLPGHWLEYKVGKISTGRYYLPENHPNHSSPRLSAEESLTYFSEVFEDSVKKRLISDVPVGLMLSGGLDSLCVYSALEELRHKTETFTVSFDHDQTDADTVHSLVDPVSPLHHFIHIGEQELMSSIDSVLYSYDEPFADSSSIPSFLISKAISERGYKVVLNGDGGDESFGGYTNYESLFSRLPLRMLKSLFPNSMHGCSSAKEIFLGSRQFFSSFLLKSFFPSVSGKHEILSELQNAVPALSTKHLQSALKKYMWVDRNFYLPNDILYKMDIATMAFGVEGRSPFLDRELIEMSFQFPDSMLVRGQEKKILLKKYLENKIPTEILNRPKKGFGSPVSKWLDQELKDDFENTVFQGSLGKSLFNQCNPGKTSFIKFINQITNHQKWNIYILERWLNNYSLEL